MTPELIRYKESVDESLRLPNAWSSDATPAGPGALRAARRNLATLQATRAALDAGHDFDDFLAVLEDAKARTPLARAEVRRLAEAAYALECDVRAMRRDTDALDADLAAFSEQWVAHRRRTGAPSEWLSRLIRLNLEAFAAALEATGVPALDIAESCRARRAAVWGQAA